MIHYREPFLLSATGSNRGTAYFLANKVITLPVGAGHQLKTHVFWTDKVAKTCARTFDHATRQWGAPVHLGNGCDNHNNPCVTADAQGYLRLAYGPHGKWDHAGQACDWPSGAFRYAVADEPNSLSGLDKLKIPFGYAATYACLVHLSNGRDAIVYRGGEHPPVLMFQRQTDLGGWTQARPLMIQNTKPEYTFYGAMMACAQDGLIYMGGCFYAASRGYTSGVAALKSADFGDTWRDLAGNPVQTPIEYAPQYAVPHPPPEADARLEGLVVDSRGMPWFLTVSQTAKDRQVLLSCWEQNQWRTMDVAAFLPPERNAVIGGLSLDTRDGLHVVVSAPIAGAIKPGEIAWSHPTSEVFHLYSADRGKSFECNQISVTDSQFPSWLPTISRPGLFHPVEKPVILYTHGAAQNLPDEDNRSSVKTEVYCVMIEDLK
ncbi:MAG: BNR-4 repeat-containing protein [Lentisphaerae bacterium]|nr:BNR-4 repeat-containing protein [Lentisphaerota bacterium]